MSKNRKPAHNFVTTGTGPIRMRKSGAGIHVKSTTRSEAKRQAIKENS